MEQSRFAVGVVAWICNVGILAAAKLPVPSVIVDEQESSHEIAMEAVALVTKSAKHRSGLQEEARKACPCACVECSLELSLTDKASRKQV